MNFVFHDLGVLFYFLGWKQRLPSCAIDCVRNMTQFLTHIVLHICNVTNSVLGELPMCNVWTSALSFTGDCLRALTHWGRARWPPLWQTKVHFLELKLLNFKQNFTEIYSLGSNWQYGSIGSDNGLAPNRRQAIIWSNVGMVHWRIYVSLSLNELRSREHEISAGTYKFLL